jgi:hypothetical protein
MTSFWYIRLPLQIGTQVTRKRTALFVLVAYIVTGLLVEATHHDALAIGSGSRQSVASHDCGAHEIHIPLDNLHPCLACYQSSQRVSTPALSFMPDAEILLCLGVIPSLDEHFLSTDFLYTGKRGPPLS